MKMTMTTILTTNVRADRSPVLFANLAKKIYEGLLEQQRQHQTPTWYASAQQRQHQTPTWYASAATSIANWYDSWVVGNLTEYSEILAIIQ